MSTDAEFTTPTDLQQDNSAKLQAAAGAAASLDPFGGPDTTTHDV